MKHLVIVFLLLVVGCVNVQNHKTANVVPPEDRFSLHRDTIVVDIKGGMVSNALKYQDKYYVIFGQGVQLYGPFGENKLYIFQNGQIDRIVDCPEAMDETFHWDFFVQNDSIKLKSFGSWDQLSYCFDPDKYIWEKIASPTDIIFEDDDFYVYYSDFGEWGWIVWFKDKKTGLEYLIGSVMPIGPGIPSVHKIGVVYYLTEPHRIVRIEDPLQLIKCEEDRMYENIGTSRKYFSTEKAKREPQGKSQVVQVIYQDTTFKYSPLAMDYHPYIVSSFVLNDKLFHVYETDTATYIASMDKNSIKPIQEIAKNISFYYRYHSFPCNNGNVGSELLKFQTKDEKLSGVLDIADGNIYIHYFLNKAELKPKSLGRAKADSIFLNRLNIILSDPDNLKLGDIDVAERTWGTFDITAGYNVGLGNSWNPKKYIIDTKKSYLIQQDSIVTDIISYYATKSNDLVRAIYYEWEEADSVGPDLKELSTDVFKAKAIFLENAITQRVGQPIGTKSEMNYAEIDWATSNGLKIELIETKSFNKIRLVIYQSE